MHSFLLWILALQVNVKGRCSVISLIVEHLVRCSVAICMFPRMNFSFLSLAHICIRLPEFYCWFVGVLYILRMSPL